MLTINADDHSLRNQMHKPGDEKRMVVILAEDAYKEWLGDSVIKCARLLSRFSVELLQAQAVNVKIAATVKNLTRRGL